MRILPRFARFVQLEESEESHDFDAGGIDAGARSIDCPHFQGPAMARAMPGDQPSKVIPPDERDFLE